MFSIDRATFLKHQTTMWLPWFFKRYFLRRKDAPEPPALFASSDSADEKIDIDVARRMSRSLSRRPSAPAPAPAQPQTQ